MELRPECYPCLERLADLTVGWATEDAALQDQARQAAREIIARDFLPGAIPACIANRYHLAIQEITGNPDPFASPKAAQSAYLARMWARIAPGYGQDLESLLMLAVLGNVIDFFRTEAEVHQDFLSPPAFGICRLEDFRERLAAPPGLVLYLADNAGEQFFDRPLVEFLRGRGRRVLYVVKGGPIQNDLTREDLYASGLGEALEPLTDTGARTVGLELDRVSPEFRKLYESARIILAKGMGHFETMSRLNDPRIFFLLQAKCEPVARALGAPRGAFVFSRAGDHRPGSLGRQDKS